MILSLHQEKGALAHLARAFDWQSKGGRFESCMLHFVFFKGATQKIFLEFGLFFFYRNNNRQQPENCNRLLFFL